MLLNDILSSISIAIREEFGTEYSIHKETVEQGLKEPCFLISSLKSNRRQELTCRHKMSTSFCIQYFPRLLNSKIECNDVSERLFNILEILKIKNDIKSDNIKFKIKGLNMNAEYVNDVLNFFVNYDVHLYKIEQYEKMQEIQERTDLK